MSGLQGGFYEKTESNHAKRMSIYFYRSLKTKIIHIKLENEQ